MSGLDIQCPSAPLMAIAETWTTLYRRHALPLLPVPVELPLSKSRHMLICQMMRTRGYEPCKIRDHPMYTI